MGRFKIHVRLKYQEKDFGDKFKVMLLILTGDRTLLLSWHGERLPRS